MRTIQDRHNVTDITYNYMPAFVLYVKENCLDDFTYKFVKLAKANHLPLLQHFSSYTAEQINAIAKETTLEFLDAIIEDNTEAYIQSAKTKWVNDMLPHVIKKNEIEIDDVAIFSYIRKQALMNFISVYTSDNEQFLQINAELDHFFYRLNSAMTSTYVQVFHEQIQEEVKSQANEERLRLAVEATQLGTWDYNILTGELIVSDKCKAILGCADNTPFTYSDFINCVFAADRNYVHHANQNVLSNPDRPYFDIEYRISNLSDHKTRWIKSNGQVLYDKNGQPYRSIGTLWDITEKKLAEEELKRSERRYSSLVKASTSVIWTTDAEGAFMLPQDSWLEYTGQPWEKHKGFGWAEMIHPDDRERVATQWQESLKHKRIHHCWGRLWCAAHNDYRYFTARAVPILDNEENVIEWIGMDTDIHDQKLAEDALQKSEEQFRHIAEAIPQMVWTADPNGNITYFNKQWIDYTGVSVDSNHPSWDLIIHPDDVPGSMAAWETSLRDGTDYDVEYRIKHKDGGPYRWFLCRALPVKDADGTIIKWFGTCTNIHDQKLTDELFKLQARVLDSMEEGVSLSDENGIILYTNVAENRIFGYAPGELKGKHVSVQNAYHEELNKEITNSIFLQLRVSGNWNGELYNKKKNGETFFTYSYISSLSIGNKTYFVCVQRDITEEKKSKEQLLESETKYKILAEELETRVAERTKELREVNRQLEQSNNDLEQFAYIASHDLQEPLRKINLFGSILRNKYAGHVSKEGVDIIGRMQSASERMKILITDLLTYSRVSKKLNTDAVDLNILLREVTDDLDALIRDKEARIHVGNLGMLNGNPLQLRQLFQNLINNSLKFSKTDLKPEIEITSILVKGHSSGFPVTEDNKKLLFRMITVKDNGIGFEQQYANRIFQMFQRLNGKVDYDGSGIGLAIVDRVIKNHNGYIIAESSSGNGACFKMLFPVKTKISS